MPRVIYKYPFEVTDTFELELHEGHEILCIQTQGDQPCMWVLCNPEKPKMQYVFDCIGTGHPIADNAVRHYVGTFQMYEGKLVFHIFKAYYQ
jgi:hypothetical protein